MINWTIEYLEKLKNEGKIRGFKLDHPPTQKQIKKEPDRTKFGSAAKQFIYEVLKEFASKHNTELVTEYQFMKGRKFRSDFSIPELRLLAEYEGIYSEKSRHTFFTGYNKDLIKYNHCSLLGFTLLRYSNKTYKNIVDDLKLFKC